MANVRLMLNSAQASLVGKGASAIVIPWKEQPPPAYKHIGNSKFVRRLCNTGYFWDSVPLCQVGDMLYLCETWRILGSSHSRGSYWIIEYKDGVQFKLSKDDYDYRRIRKAIVSGNWRSPATMPNKACRHVYPCTGIEGVMVKLVFRDMVRKIGFQTILNLPFDSWVRVITFNRQERS